MSAKQSIFISSVQKELALERRAIKDFKISQCAQAGLAAPEFRQDGGQFIQTLWRPNVAADVVEVTAAGTKPGTKSGPSQNPRQSQH